MEYPAQPPPLPEIAPLTPKPRGWLVGMILALLLIFGSLGYTIWHVATDAAEVKVQELEPNTQLELRARYFYGIYQFIGYLDKKKADDETKELVAETQDATDVDKFRWEILKEALGFKTTEQEMEQITRGNPKLQEDEKTLGGLRIQPKDVPAEQWKTFEKHHGWFAKLAWGLSLPSNAPEKRALVRDGVRTVIALVSVVVFLFLAFICGVVFLVIGMCRWRAGKLLVIVRRPNPVWGGVLLEGFSIYVASMSIVPAALHHWWQQWPWWSRYCLILVLGLVAFYWPRWRGVSAAQWRMTLGLHRGRGVLREIGVGLLGWTCVLPFLLACLPLVYFIDKHTHSLHEHPVDRLFSTSGWTQVFAVFLAVVWAPLTEETMFRGLLLTGFSSLIRWVAGAILAAFVFAALHPQGMAAVPVLMLIALMFSILRLTRGSLIPSMAAHALNNGLIAALLVFTTG